MSDTKGLMPDGPDPIAFVKALAEALVPLGVLYVEYGSLKMQFNGAGGFARAAQTASTIGQMTSAEQAELEAEFDQDSDGTPPEDDPTTYMGPVPGYPNRPKKRARDEE